MKALESIPFLVLPATGYATLFFVSDIFFLHMGGWEALSGIVLGVFLGVWPGLRTLQKHALPVDASFRDYRSAKESINAPRP